jgi:hypothetical protein
MTALRGGVIGLLAGTAAFIVLEHAARLRGGPIAIAASLPTATAVPSPSPGLDRGEADATGLPAAASPPIVLLPEGPPDRPSPAAAPKASATTPGASETSSTPAAASPTLLEAGRRAAELAEAMERLGRRLERGLGPGAAR